MRVASEAVAWPRSGSPRRAGVSSFGFSGTNAHVVLEEAPLEPEAASAPLAGGGARGVVGPDRAGAVGGCAASARASDAGRCERGGLGDVAYSLATTRTHHEHRLAVPASTLEELTAALEAIEQGATPAGAVRGQVSRAAGGVAWLFTGQGSQQAGMGHGLYASWPVFRAALEAAFAAFAAASSDGGELKEVMWGERGRPAGSDGVDPACAVCAGMGACGVVALVGGGAGLRLRSHHRRARRRR